MSFGSLVGGGGLDAVDAEGAERQAAARGHGAERIPERRRLLALARRAGDKEHHVADGSDAAERGMANCNSHATLIDAHVEPDVLGAGHSEDATAVCNRLRGVWAPAARAACNRRRGSEALELAVAERRFPPTAHRGGLSLQQRCRRVRREG